MVSFLAGGWRSRSDLRRVRIYESSQTAQSTSTVWLRDSWRCLMGNPGSTLAQETPPSSPPQQTESEASQSIVLPVGLNLGQRSVIDATPVLGLEDGTQEVDFEQWLIPLEDVLQVLGYRKTVTETGEFELRSVGGVVRLNPEDLTSHPRLGLAISVGQIQEILKTPAQFDLAQYVITFTPSWLEKDLPDLNYARRGRPISLEGLPQIAPPGFSLAGVSGRINVNSTDDSTNTTSEVDLIGSFLGGGWFATIDRLGFDEDNPQLEEFQYLRQTPSFDLAAGSQQSFWDLQTSGQFWGVTTIQRWGFPPRDTVTSLGRGFSPNTRLESRRRTRTISGIASPGSLVQLAIRAGERIIGEVLVDDSGVYRFENISSISSPLGGIPRFSNYKVFIYPEGQLTATPEIREVTFQNLASQIPQGSSALVLSAGTSRQLQQDEFLGTFEDLLAGASYRYGVTENITLGAGVVYDESLLGLSEIFFAPSGIPLRIRAAALVGTDDGIDFNAFADYDISQNLSLRLSANENFQSFNANWRVLPGLNANLNGNLNDGSLGGGLNWGLSSPQGSIFTSLNLDSNRELRWNLRSRYSRFQLLHRGRRDSTRSELAYDLTGFSRGFNRENTIFTRVETNATDYLATVGGRFSPQQLTSFRDRPWTLELGYGIGSEGRNGILASVTTRFIPGLDLRASYETVSISSSENRFRIELRPSLLFQPRLNLGQSRLERLRSEGGLVLQPFFDNNGNGKRDAGEAFYTEDADLLFLLNNRAFSRFSRFNIDSRSNGIFLRLIPDTYRLDIDPAGYPLGWKTQATAFAVKVIPGAFTRVSVPLIKSFAMAGIAQDSEGNPLIGARVEAVPIEPGEGRRVISITNGAGIFFLEGLELGRYNLTVVGQPAEPGSIEITPDSEAFQEINLTLPDLPR